MFKGEIWELMLTLILVTGCHTLKTLSQVNLPVFDKEGHRGSRGLMPENTIPAMLYALELGVTTLEMDASVTSDEQVILSHEPFFNHVITTRPDGTFISEKEEKDFNIFRMSYAETLKFDVGSKAHPTFAGQKKMAAHKPLLSEVIDSAEAWCKKFNRDPPFYNIETKTSPETDNIFHPDPEKFVDLLMKVVTAKGVTPRVIVQSFDFRTLQLVHQKYPGVKTAALIEGSDKRTVEEQVAQLGFIPVIYSPHYSLVNEALIQRCHQQKMKIVPWTVNEKRTMQELKNLGVDGIITDYPDLLKDL